MDIYDGYMGGISSHPDSFWAIMPVIMSVLGIILAISLVVGIICYVFNSLGLYTMAKNRNLDNPWLAWIPFASSYLMGELINDDVSIGTWHIPYAKLFLPLMGLALSIVMMVLGFIPYLGAFVSILLSLALSFYYYAAQFWLYSIYDKDHRVLYLVLSIIFPFLGPIFIFIVRNRTPYDERHPEVVAETYDSKSILALTLGIISIVSVITFIGSGLFTGAVGLIFGMIAMKERKLQGLPTGMAMAGLICSIIGMAFTVLMVFACITCIGVGGMGMLGGLMDGMYY
ncbi:DUF4190 domain-containing protein [Acetobacterium carbinolicum]|jgi:hypothetical protein|uniref:DUF4190 domain-containing protein n=1 Tax=Acetobacterium TaxID=33951 RepID=UPI001FA93CAE|nr:MULTISPECIES: DUF4190 domain-containing protein [unclassified Acetobacterium]MDK2941501.1 hypothetical protein [Acetobacterium sp.]MDZ5725165.1 DUF4190 domain-containing protein [Acetobacterium sp. K1/6]